MSCDTLTRAPSTQIEANKDGVVLLGGDDLVAPVAPQVDPHLVSGRQQHRAADAGHLAAVIGEAGVVHGGQTLPVLKYGALSAPVDRHVHGEVVEPLQRAGEDTPLGVVAVALVDQHVHQLQDPRVVGSAVGRVQLGCEGHHPPSDGENKIK